MKAFEKFGITASIEQARAPMGAPKWNHIRAMMDDPDIAALVGSSAALTISRAPGFRLTQPRLN